MLFKLVAHAGDAQDVAAEGIEVGQLDRPALCLELVSQLDQRLQAGAVHERHLVGQELDERERGRRWGIEDFEKKYTLPDLASGDVMFAATGVTDGSMLRGVRRGHHGARTHSMVMRSKTGTVRIVEAQHNFERKTWYESIGA